MSALIRVFFMLFSGIAMIAQPAEASGAGQHDHPSATAAPASHEHEYLKNLRDAEASVALARQALSDSTVPSRAALSQLRQKLADELGELSQQLAFVGDEPGSRAAFDEIEQLTNRPDPPGGDADEPYLANIDSAIAVDAIDEIVEAARSRQIVILNEAHQATYDRAFAMQLARRLRKIGFQYMACETFTPDDLSVLSGGYVSTTTGYYSSEPTFANFLTDALGSGWKFVSYEAPKGHREFQMAQNVITRVLAKEPQARIFIYAGFSHASKLPVSETETDSSRFAGQLRRLTGIEPLTVDQTVFYPDRESDRQQLYYRHAFARQKGPLPFVLKTASGRNLQLPGLDGGYDFEVVHPEYPMDRKTQRPSWLGMPMLGDRHPRPIPATLLPASGRRLIYAYRLGSPYDAVPADLVLVKAGGVPPQLMLPVGEFRFEYED